MHRPATPIYASTLHRRDRAWGARRRAVVRLRARAAVLCGTFAVLGVLALERVG